jgi:hypothetical protein
MSARRPGKRQDFTVVLCILKGDAGFVKTAPIGEKLRKGARWPDGIAKWDIRHSGYSQTVYPHVLADH